MRIGAIIQARMGSRRLPGKVLAPVRGRPLLQYTLERVGHARGLSAVAVATSETAADDAIEASCRAWGTPCVRGPLEDVARRFLLAARRLELDSFVRICADSPLIDPALVERGICAFRAGDADLVTNTFPRTFPPGQSVEVVDVEALAAAVPAMHGPEHREHVTRYFYDHADRYRIRNLRSERDYGDLRLSVDTAEDLARLRTLIEGLRRPHWTYGLHELAALALRGEASLLA